MYYDIYRRNHNNDNHYKDNHNKDDLENMYACILMFISILIITIRTMIRTTSLG